MSEPMVEIEGMTVNDYLRCEVRIKELMQETRKWRLVEAMVGR